MANIIPDPNAPLSQQLQKPALNYNMPENLQVQSAGGYSPSRTPLFGAQDMRVGQAPNPMDMKAQLNSSIMQDVNKAQTSMGEVQKGLGLNVGAEKTFQNRGYMVGKQLVAQNEYAAAEKQRKQVSRELARVVGLGDMAATSLAEEQLNNKFKKIEFELIKKAVAFDAKLKAQGIDEAQRRQAAQMWGTLAGTLAGGIIGGVATGGNPMGAMAGAGMGAGVGGAVGQGVASQGA